MEIDSPGIRTHLGSIFKSGIGCSKRKVSETLRVDKVISTRTSIRWTRRHKFSNIIYFQQDSSWIDMRSAQRNHFRMWMKTEIYMVVTWGKMTILLQPFMVLCYYVSFNHVHGSHVCKSFLYVFLYDMNAVPTAPNAVWLEFLHLVV